MRYVRLSTMSITSASATGLCRQTRRRRTHQTRRGDHPGPRASQPGRRHDGTEPRPSAPARPREGPLRARAGSADRWSPSFVAPLTFPRPAATLFVSYLSHRGVSSTCPWVVAAPGGPWAGWFQRRCARAPSLTSVLVPGLAPGGDKMFDGVIPLGEALRPLSLSRRSTRRRPTCRQNDAGSRPRRIGMTKGLTRANDLLEEVRGLVCRPAGRLGCPIAEPKPGSSGQLIRVLVGRGTREPATAAA